MSDIRWYTTLALWKSIVFMEGNYKRAIAGTTDDPYLKAFGEGVLELARQAEAVGAWLRLSASALLIDWGGVLTTNLFASFHDFCLRAEIDPKLLLGRFRTDPEARKLLVALETGALDEAATSRSASRAMLEVEPDGLDRRPVRGRRARRGDGRRRAPRARTPACAPRSSRTPGACTATRTICSTSCSTAS